MKTVKAQQRRFEREAEHMTEFPDTEEAIFFDFTAGAAIPRGKCVLDFLLPQLCAGDRILSRDIKLSVYGPEHIGIIGANGAGKTTLLRRIAEELLPRRDITRAICHRTIPTVLTWRVRRWHLSRAGIQKKKQPVH